MSVGARASRQCVSMQSAAACSHPGNGTVEIDVPVFYYRVICIIYLSAGLRWIVIVGKKRFITMYCVFISVLWLLNCVQMFICFI